MWRDYYSGEKLDDFEKPWKKPHDKLYGESKDGLGLYTWWSKHGHVIQFPGGKSPVLRPGEVALAKMTNFLLCSAEAQKPGWQGGIATRKVFARPESFCA